MIQEAKLILFYLGISQRLIKECKILSPIVYEGFKQCYSKALLLIQRKCELPRGSILLASTGYRMARHNKYVFPVAGVMLFSFLVMDLCSHYCSFTSVCLRLG